MSIKYKITNIITAHPKLVVFGISFTIAVIIGSAIGTLDHGQQALVYARRCPLC